MKFKLLWSIVKVNFKKNWIMILSFFVFLLISLSIVFGMTSFMVGLHNETPLPALQKQKYYTTFDTYYLNQSNNINEGTTYTKPSDEFLENVSEEINKIDGGNNGDVLSKKLLNGYHGNTYWLLQKSKDAELNESEIKTLDTLTNYLLEHWGNADIFSYVLYNKYLMAEDVYKNIDQWSFRYPYQQYISATMTNSYSIYSKNSESLKRIISLFDFETKSYSKKDNVFYVSPKAEEYKNYILGQTYSLIVKDVKQDFIYGGKATAPMNFTRADNVETYYYYLMNYVPAGKDISQDLRKDLYSEQADYFIFREPNSSMSKSQQQSYWESIAHDSWLAKPENNSNKENPNQVNDNKAIYDAGWYTHNFLYSAYMIYEAFLLLTIVFAVILLALDIAIAWFLIREIIRSLSHEMLMLKTLGLSNIESSFISASTLLIILGSGLCLGLVGMLGIQALFINVASKLVDIYFVWSHIQAFSLIVVFGSIVFLFVAYFISSIFLVRRLDTASNEVTLKSDYRFAKLQRKLFKQNANLGMTFSFSVKNLNKILTTFFITLLITCLSFVALGFKSSINEGQKRQDKISFNSDNMSYSTNIQFNAKKDNTYENVIEYNPQKLNSSNEYKAGDDDVTGKFITEDSLKELPQFKEIINNYDNKITSMYPKVKPNFTINFGAVYYGGYISETSFSLYNYGFNNSHHDRLIVVAQNDPRYKQLFGDETSGFSCYDGLPSINVTVGPNFLKSHNAEINDYSGNGASQDHLEYFIHNGGAIGYDNFKLHYIKSYDGIAYNNEAYVKQSDYINLINYYIKNSDTQSVVNFYKFISEQFKNGAIENSFFSNSVPLEMQQFVIPNLGYRTLDDYISYLKKNGISRLMNRNGTNYYSLYRSKSNEMLDPLINTMIVMLALIIVLDLSFIIFMIMSIMNENDDIIFILKALGYEKKEIFWRIVSGYLLSIVLSIIIGTIIAGVILSALSTTFVQIISLGLSLYWSGPIIGLFVALIIGLPMFVIGISSYKITARDLTTESEAD